ncbi:unnamed protein product [Pleuronectes platessa]|uniref:Uncharacterized protein n=1 Tax=Pleuronectes platessa TaxID=8262 RepID=A0A9N7VB74_PLEPL|nr:unnamed protein product [Pleuronectes platessa]
MSNSQQPSGKHGPVELQRDERLIGQEDENRGRLPGAKLSLLLITFVPALQFLQLQSSHLTTPRLIQSQRQPGERTKQPTSDTSRFHNTQGEDQLILDHQYRAATAEGGSVVRYPMLDHLPLSPCEPAPLPHVRSVEPRAARGLLLLLLLMFMDDWVNRQNRNKGSRGVEACTGCTDAH